MVMTKEGKSKILRDQLDDMGIVFPVVEDALVEQIQVTVKYKSSKGFECEYVDTITVD